MPGASSMRGVTGFRVLDAMNGALAQLIPDRVPAAGEGGNTLAIFGADRPGGGEPFVYYELVVGTWGGTPICGRQRRPHEPGQPRGEHPGRGGRVGVPDRGRALRARARHRRRRRHRGGLAVERVWRCLTPDTSLHRALRPRAAVRPYGLARRRAGAALEQRPRRARRDARRRCRRCSRPRSRPATSTSTASRAAAAGATRSSATRTRSPRTSRTRRCRVEAAGERYGVVVGQDGDGRRAPRPRPCETRGEGA